MSDRRWEAALAEHRRALDGYAEAVLALDGAGWTRPWAEGKWTPALITEHLVLTYRAFLQEASGGAPMRQKVHGWRLRLLRWFLLPHMLFHRTFPRGAVAPREVRPTGADPGPAAALAELRELVAACEREVERGLDRPAVLTHPYFGGIPAARALRFAAVHLEHHTRQVRAAGARGA